MNSANLKEMWRIMIMNSSNKAQVMEFLSHEILLNMEVYQQAVITPVSAQAQSSSSSSSASSAAASSGVREEVKTEGKEVKEQKEVKKGKEKQEKKDKPRDITLEMWGNVPLVDEALIEEVKYISDSKTPQSQQQPQPLLDPFEATFHLQMKLNVQKFQEQMQWRVFKLNHSGPVTFQAMMDAGMGSLLPPLSAPPAAAAGASFYITFVGKVFQDGRMYLKAELDPRVFAQVDNRVPVMMQDQNKNAKVQGVRFQLYLLQHAMAPAAPAAAPAAPAAAAAAKPVEAKDGKEQAQAQAVEGHFDALHQWCVRNFPEMANACLARFDFLWRVKKCMC